MALQSYLFFGSANRLYQHVKTLLARQPECRFLIFDFRLRHRHQFIGNAQLRADQASGGRDGARIVLVNLTPELEKVFRTARFISDDMIVASDLDRALEACEQTSSRSISPKRRRAVAARLAVRGLGDCRPCRQAGRILPAARGSGRRRHRPAGRPRRFDAFHPGGPCRHHRRSRRGPDDARAQPRPAHDDRRNGPDYPRPRSATIQAEAPSVLYELSADAYESSSASSRRSARRFWVTSFR